MGELLVGKVEIGKVCGKDGSYEGEVPVTEPTSQNKVKINTLRNSN